MFESYANGIDILKAVHPKDHGNMLPEAIPFERRGCSERLDVPNLTWRDIPDRESDGSFNGCGNQAWILSPEEKEHYINLNAERQKVIDEKYAKEREEWDRLLAEKAIREAAYTVVKVYKLVYPCGDENGPDGYWDADIQSNEDGVVTRIIMRNVFDFGYYGYPYRLNGKKELNDRKNWTEAEIKAYDWASEFCPLPHQIFM